MKTITTLTALMLMLSVTAQKVLTPEEAVSIALRNNYGILVAYTATELAAINNSAGNSGMLPSVGISAAGSFESNNIEQEMQGGIQNSYSPLSTTRFNVGAELSWTLFDGGKMFIAKDRLAETENLSRIELKNNILETQAAVLAAYFGIVKQKQQLMAYNEIFSFNEERFRIAETGFNTGLLSRPDWLQAKMDLNTIRENIITQEYNVESAKKDLLLLLGSSDFTTFDVTDSISTDYMPDQAKLLARIDTANTAILALQSRMEIARLIMNENKRSALPEINLNAGYYLSQYNNSDGSILHNYSLGPAFGATLRIPIYQAGDVKRQIKTAGYELKSAGYELQNISAQIKSDLVDALAAFDYQIRLIEIEKENNALARENLEISIQRLAKGQTTSLEIHMAQELYIQSTTRLISFRYNLKLAETRLKQLAAEF